MSSPDIIFTEHLAGKLIDGIQRCVICGLELANYTNTFSIEGDTQPRGWREGSVYVCGFYTAIEPDAIIVKCKP